MAAKVAATLKERLFWGETLLPGSEGYKRSVTTWWLSPYRNPAPEPVLVVRPRSTKDCALAVHVAREHGLTLTVRCGGHSLEQTFLQGNSLLVDMTLMQGVFVDPEARTASVEGGCWLGDIDAETTLYGLATPLGLARVTGMGLVLHGGFGMASRMYGLSCANVLAATLVLADGSVETVSAKKGDPELFWAVRGAGAALGIVTKLVMQLHDVSDFWGGVILFKDDEQHDTLRKLLHWQRDHAYPVREIAMSVYYSCKPGVSRLMMVMLGYFGPKSAEEKAQAVQPLRDLGPMQDYLGQMSYADYQNAFTRFSPTGDQPRPHEFCRSFYGTLTLPQTTDDLLEGFIRICGACPYDKLPATLLMVDVTGAAYGKHDGPVGYTPDADMALLAQPMWTDASHHEAAAAVCEQMRGLLKGVGGKADVYVNVSGPDARLTSRVGGEDNLKRLREVKQRVDPQNFFTAHPFKGL
ncbi:hypothetical protein WJX73_004757 [Symbiochloris irregularis]|uniref:FAD-binding PCMH-type domain-containing protein n=1 Tax=Symbiochloris irregularis TaxID=706552 RepID=A0AAW1PLX8_9CHLO